ncbi:hypothetical protein EWM64_g188 [Hericium alpestre]|uniref:F-box domain-containing protein n=1 Tax=Hericium alpestre TaxID=135208 RepID=A0A4Z0ABQ7_9AGAM|nr:hypothetical protein EWM64_g188 [Hericium alpestre]
MLSRHTLECEMLILSYDLSLEDIAAVHGEIEAHERTVEALESEIHDVLREANRLRSARQQHLDFIKRCKGMITLARRAPDEVLGQIFDQCAAAGWAKAPLVASHVCRKWRRAALAPRIWSRIHLNSDSLDPVGRTGFWLLRAAESDLYVTVDIRVLDPQLIRAMEMLIDRTAQWRTFNLHARFVQQTQEILGMCNRPAPQLREVTVYTLALALDGDENAEDLACLSETIQHAPHLRTVSTICNKFPVAVPNQIRELSMELVPFSTGPVAIMPVLTMLEKLLHLERLTLTVPSDFSEAIVFPAPDVPPAILRELRILIINAYPGFNAFLRHVDTRELCRLHLRSSDAPLNFPHEDTGSSLRQFIDQCSPPLELLELHDIDIPCGDFAHCFLNIPSLEELRLHETEIPNEAIALLNGPTGACPRLKRLDLRWCEQLSGRTLVDLVASKKPAAADAEAARLDPIEDITVINCALVKEGDVMALARMINCSVVARNLDDHCQAAVTTSGTGSG